MAAKLSEANANSDTKVPIWDLPSQRGRAFGRTTERSRSRSKYSNGRGKYWNLRYDIDPKRMMVRGRPTRLTGNNSDSRLNQNRRAFVRDVSPSPLRHREIAANDHSPPRYPFSRRSFSSGPSQPRRVVSPSPPPPPPRNDKQGPQARSQTQREFCKCEEQKQTCASPLLRTPTNIDLVYNSVEAKDVTVHMELDLFNDLGEELEIFNRLTRTGNFALAREFLDSHLEAHVDDPPVFVQYAEMLLEQGDFKSLLLLDGGPVFREHGYGRLGDSESAIHRLEVNWKLIKAVALCHSQHSLSNVWECIDRPLKVVPNALDTNSTELKIFGLAIRLHHLTRTRVIFDSLSEGDWREWADWKKLYKRLLEEDRIWDFRDIFFALIEFCNTKDVLAELVDSKSPSDQMLADWETSSPDESTSLALLDMLSLIVLNVKTPLGTLPLGEESMRSAERISNSILDNFPHAVHTRPFIQWVVAKALIESGRVRFDYLLNYPGQAFLHSRSKMPYYIPLRKENPEWLPGTLTAIGRESLEMALSSSRTMQDYQSEARCMKELALRTKAPGALFDDLAHLQKSKQLDKAGYLSTCLSRYLTCKDESSKASLLRDLESFGRWHNPSNLINPNTAAGRDVLQCALSPSYIDGTAKSMEFALRYYEYLDAPFVDTIDRNIATSPMSVFEVLSPSPLHTGSGRHRRSAGKNSNDKKTTGQASKAFGSDTKHGNDDKMRNDQQCDYYSSLPCRDTRQTEGAHQTHYSSDDEDRWEHRRESLDVRRHQNHNTADSTSRRSSGSSLGSRRGRERTTCNDGRQSRRSRSHSLGNGRRPNSAPEQSEQPFTRYPRKKVKDDIFDRTAREDVDDAHTSRQTRGRGDQDQQHAQARTGNTPRRSPPTAVQTPFLWEDAVVEEFDEDEASCESRHEADDEFDVSEVMEDVGACSQESTDDSADSRARYQDAESHWDKKTRGG